MGGEIRLPESDIDGSVKTMGGEVLVENVTGTVEATSMGGKVIQKNVHGRGSDAKSGELRVKSMGGEIRIDDAPEGANLHTMGGPITCAFGQRFVKAETMGGNVDIDAVDGWVEATTMGGDVKVSMTGDPAQGDRHVNLSSMGGDVDPTVPAGLAMDIDIELSYTKGKSGMYKIESDFPLQQNESPEWTTHHGSPEENHQGNREDGKRVEHGENIDDKRQCGDKEDMRCGMCVVGVRSLHSRWRPDRFRPFHCQVHKPG